MGFLFHSFATKDQHYIYSTISNEIIQVSSLTSKIIGSLFKERSSFEKTINKFNKKYPLEEIVDSCLVIKTLVSKNILGVADNIRIINRQFPEEPSISTLIIEVTEDCNFRCDYCSYSGNYLGLRIHSKNSIDLDLTLKTIKQLSEIQKENLHVGFYGGEPLLEINNIKRIVNCTKSKFREGSFSITTNGYALTDKSIEFLINSEFTICVSLDGPKYKHDSWRKTKTQKETYDKIIANLKAVKSKNEQYYQNKLGYNCVLIPPYQFLKIEEFFNQELFKHNEVNFIFVNRFDTKLNFDDSSQELDNYELQLLEEKYIDTLSKGKVADRPKIIKSLYETPLKKIHHRIRCTNQDFPLNGPCLPGIHKLYLNSAGTYQICEKAGQALVLGNVSSGIDFVRCEEIMGNYYNFVRDKCKDCWTLRL